MNTTVYNYQDPLSLAAAGLILLNCTLGIIFSSLIIYIFYVEKTERNSFMLICLSRAINNITVLVFNYLIVAFPVILIGHNFYPFILETTIAISAVNFYLVNEFQVLIIAANRFIALYFPLQYNRIFGIRTTMIMLLLLYIWRLYGTVVQLIVFIDYKCAMLFSSDSLSAALYPPDCRPPFSVGSAILGTIFCFILGVVLNIVTFVKILRFLMTSQNGNKESRLRIKKNILLFFQTILQDSLFLIDILFTFQLSSLSSQRYWTFISVSFVWQTIHTLDGFIMMMFNERLTFLKKTLWSTSSVNSQVSTTPHHQNITRIESRHSTSTYHG